MARRNVVPRKWARADQVRSERPREPLTAHCATCGSKRRTVIRWYGQPRCLVCDGCPRCGARQVWETPQQFDGGLFVDPILLGGRPIRGTWDCLLCAERLVDWPAYRTRVLRWRAGNLALAEGYRRPEDRAA